MLVLSPAYLADEFTQFTDLLAQWYGLETATWPVLPLNLEPVQLPARLSALVALDTTDPEDREVVLARLLAELECPVPKALPKPPCPYPGMVPFREVDSDRFFGRDGEVQEALERLRLHPFLAVIGPSGSGKSSYVYAGLVPALRQNGLFGPGKWLVRPLRPGDSPERALSVVLGDDPSDPERVVANLLSAAVQRPAHPDARRLLLVVDQFEEAFATTLEARELFERALLALSQVPECHVVLTVRADFYGDLMASGLWDEIQGHRIELPPLGQEGMRQAIVLPAEGVGVYVETALVERLVGDAAGEPGILPLVQETLVLLWERLERRYLPLRAYEALVLTRHAYGGQRADGPGREERTGLQVAMARRAEATLEALPEGGQAIARRTFLRLIQFGEGRADTRRQQMVSALRAADDDPLIFDRTLGHLTGNRLLTMSGEQDDPGRRVDISHEALIDGWPTLRGWVDERREAEQTRRALQDKAAEWVRLGRESGGLLDEIELAGAERWLTSPDAADLGYDEALPALIDASRAAQEASVLQRRRAIRFRLGAIGAIGALIMVALVTGLLSARQVAQQQQSAAARAQTDRNTQATLAVEASNAEATAVAERDIAEAARAEADEQRQIALARQLAAQAELIRSSAGGSWILAGLLAVESLHHRSDAAEAVPVLYRVLGRRGLPISRLEHDAEVYSVAFSPDGRWVATVSADGTARLWDASAESLTETLCRHLTRNLTQKEWQQYVGEEPYHCTCPSLPPGEGTPVGACSATQ